MKPINLPPDLKTFVRRALLWRVLPFCLLEAGVIALLVCLGDDLFGQKMPVVYRFLIYLPLLAIPFLITKFPWNLRERTFCGRVLSVSFDRTFSIGGGVSRPLSRGGMMMFHTEGSRAAAMWLTVRLPDGRVIRQKLPAPCHPNPPPAEGAEVFHLFGSAHVLTLPTLADDHLHCAVCNDINPLSASHCRACGRSLIRTEDMPR